MYKMKKIFIYLFVSYYIGSAIDIGDNSYNLFARAQQNGVKGGSSSFSKTSSFTKSSALTPSAISRLQANKYQQSSIITQQQVPQQQQQQQQQQVFTQTGQFTQTQLVEQPPPPVIESTIVTNVEQSSSSAVQQSDSEPTVYGSVSGVPGVDFPGFTIIPNTKFSCEGRLYDIGMYADEETGCQVYHLCYRGRKESFLCGIGTVFNQAILACDYWHSVRCSDSSQYYSVNADMGKSSSEPVTGGLSSFSKVTLQETKTLRPVPPPPPPQTIQKSVSSFKQTISNNQIQQIQPTNPLHPIGDGYSSEFQSEFLSNQQQQQQARQPVQQQNFGGKTSFRQEKSSSSLLSPSRQALAAFSFQAQRSTRNASLIPVGTGLRVSTSVGSNNNNGPTEGEIDVLEAASELRSSRLLNRSSKLNSLLNKPTSDKPSIPGANSAQDDEWKPYVRSISLKGLYNSNKQQLPVDNKVLNLETTNNKSIEADEFLHSAPNQDKSGTGENNQTDVANTSNTSLLSNNNPQESTTPTTLANISTSSDTLVAATTAVTPPGDKQLDGDKLEAAIEAEEVMVSKSKSPLPPPPPPSFNISVNPNIKSESDNIGNTTTTTNLPAIETTLDDKIDYNNNRNAIRLSTSEAILADETPTTVASSTNLELNNLTATTAKSLIFVTSELDLQKLPTTNGSTRNHNHNNDTNIAHIAQNSTQAHNKTVI